MKKTIPLIFILFTGFSSAYANNLMITVSNSCSPIIPPGTTVWINNVTIAGGGSVNQPLGKVDFGSTPQSYTIQYQNIASSSTGSFQVGWENPNYISCTYSFSNGGAQGSDFIITAREGSANCQLTFESAGQYTLCVANQGVSLTK